MNTTELRKWLAAGKTERVLDALLAPGAAIDPDLHHEATLISARFETLSREKRLGTLSFQDENQERAQINAALLEIINELPENEQKPGLFGNKWTQIGGSVVILVGLLGGMAEFSGYSLRDIFGKKETAAQVVPVPENTQHNLPTTDTPAQNPGPAQRTEAPAPTRAQPAASTEAPLTIVCKSDKGRLNVHYKSGQTMRFYIKVNRPCTVRSIYKLADKRLVLLANDRPVTAAEVGRWLEIGPGFEVAEPFGEEWIYVFAQNTNAPFPPLTTRREADGYLFITDGLPEALAKTRGFKEKQRFAQADLMVQTHL